MAALQLSAYDSFFFDIDGVIWEAQEPLPGAIELLNHLTAQGKQVYFMTNNATNSRALFQQKFRHQGFECVPENIFCAAYGVALYLKNTFPANAKVFVIGEPGMADEIEAAGFRTIRGHQFHSRKLQSPQEFSPAEVDSEVQAVAVGYTPSLNYFMLAYATICIGRGAAFVTANPDKYDRLGEFLVPGCGCTVAALQASTGKEVTVVGKPNTFLLEQACTRDGLAKERMIMFGDKMSIDILLAKRFGIHSALTFTGVENETTYKEYEFAPEYTLQTLEGLIEQQSN